MDIREYLKKYRHKINGAQLSKLLGVERSTVNMLKNRKHNPSLLLAIKICLFTQGEVAITDLMTDESRDALERISKDIERFHVENNMKKDDSPRNLSLNQDSPCSIE